MADTQITLRLRNKLVKIHESRRHKKTISYLKDLIARHTKSDPSQISLSMKLNEYLEANTSNRYKPITLSLNKADGFVRASLPNEAKPVEKKVEAKPAVEKKAEAKPASKAVAKESTASKPAEAAHSAKTEEAKPAEAKPAAPKKEKQAKPASDAKEKAEKSATEKKQDEAPS